MGKLFNGSCYVSLFLENKVVEVAVNEYTLSL